MTFKANLMPRNNNVNDGKTYKSTRISKLEHVFYHKFRISSWKVLELNTFSWTKSYRSARKFTLTF